MYKKTEITIRIPKIKDNGEIEKDEEGREIEDLQKKNILDIIASELAFNYVTNSFGVKDQKGLDIETISSDKEFTDLFESRNSQKCRNIIIVGAGASKDSYAELPTGNDMITGFTKKYITGISTVDFLKEKYEQIKRETESLSQHGFDFENFLYVMSNSFVTQSSLRKEIAHYTDFRFSPSLFYEIIAHLLNHGFLDAVINFNFEQILDQAVEDEIDKLNYKNILSDGDCEDFDNFLVDGRLKTPLYIKPHGTASHKSTLRFTNRHYLDLPDDIEKLLKKLFRGYRGERIKPIQRVNLFVFGYAMNSLELNNIFNDDLPKDTRIYHFGWSKEDKADGLFDNELKKLKKRLDKNGVSIEERYQYFQLDEFVKKSNNELTSPFAEIISYIWRKTQNMFKPPYRPRSIARHEITSYLFQKLRNNDNKKYNYDNVDTSFLDDLRNDYDNSPKYFRDRIFVEIALELIRNNGIIDIVSSLESGSRIGKYYSLYVKACENHEDTIKRKHSIYELLDCFCNNSFLQKGESNDENKDTINQNFEFAKNIFKIIPIKFQDEDNEWKEKLKKVWELVEYQSDKIVPNKTEKNNTDNTDGTDNKKDKKENTSSKKEYEKGDFLKSLTDIFDEEIAKTITKGTDKKITETTEGKILQINLTVLFYLFSNPLISKDFKVRLIKRYELEVYNGLTFVEKKKHIYNPTKIGNPSTLLNELFRLFLKSSGSHYFYIRPKYNDSKHYMWESFSNKRLIHTNLALQYQFNDMFFNRTWNCLLCVLETGIAVKKAIEDLREHRKKVGNTHKDRKNDILNDLESGTKKIIMINALSATRQLHDLNDDIVKEIDDLISEHHEYIGSDIKNSKASLFIRLLSTNSHNHHNVIFLNTKQSEFKFHENVIFKDIKGYSGLVKSVVGAISIYRRGYSHAITPLYLGLQYNELPTVEIYSDLSKILMLFFTYLCRTANFKKSSDDQENDDSDAKEAKTKNIIDEFLDKLNIDPNNHSFLNSKNFKKKYKKFEIFITKELFYY